LLPAASNKRGGKFRVTTLQWTEVLARLRGEQIKQGDFGVWGAPIKIAEALDWLGLRGRAPRKMDFRYNFAVSGAECSDLMTGYYRQASRLLAQMNRAPEKWRHGLVMIQIGVNSIGQNDFLDRYAKSGVTPAIRAEIMACVEAHRQTISLIAASHPETRFVVAGIFDNTNVASNFERWTTPVELANIAAALDIFDAGLRSLAAANPKIAFIDARAWFRDYWGGRDADGKPGYRSVNLGGTASVTNTRGDDPRNAILADEHGGVVYNALWARRIIEEMNSAFGLNIEPIAISEIALLVDPAGAFGLRRL
jgi:GDSL-like Lipase/Acylhydrolase family